MLFLEVGDEVRKFSLTEGNVTGIGLGVFKISPYPVFSLCFRFLFKDVSSQLPTPVVISATCVHASLPGWILIHLQIPNKLMEGDLVMMLYITTEIEDQYKHMHVSGANRRLMKVLSTKQDNVK